MGMRRYMKQGDTKPDFNPVLTLQSTGAPIDFSEALTITVTGYQRGAVIFEDEPADGYETGQVVMEWPAGSTDDVGEIQCYVTITWAPGQVQTIPGAGHLAVVIEPKPGFGAESSSSSSS